RRDHPAFPCIRPMFPPRSAVADGGVRGGRRVRGMRKWPLAALLIAGALSAARPEPAAAQPACEQPVGILVAVEGVVEARTAGAFMPAAARSEQPVCEGDTITAGPNSRAGLALANGVVIRIDQNTSLRVVALPADAGERSLFDLSRGAAQFFSPAPQRLDVTTPFVHAAVEGTEFLVEVGADSAETGVSAGVVRASTPLGSVPVAAFQAATARAGAPPVLTVPVRPFDAVHWALHYPPLPVPAGSPLA